MPEYIGSTPAPEGWRWQARPTQDSYGEWQAGRLTFTANRDHTLDDLATLYTALREWAAEWQCLAQDYGDPHADGTDFIVCRSINIYPGLYTDDYNRRYWPDQWCRHGHNHGPVRTDYTCDHGESTELLYDSTNGYANGVVRWTPEENQYRQGGNVLRCVFPVSDAEYQRRLNSGQYVDAPHNNHTRRAMRECGNGVLPSFSVCSDCEERVECGRCHTQFQEGSGEYLPGVEPPEFYCHNCFQHYCEGCNGWGDQPCRYVENDDSSSERLCAQCRLTQQNERYEFFDPEVDNLPAAVLALQNNAHRPVRTCSIEMETVDGGAQLARVLQEASLSQYGEVTGYHSSTNITSFCHVERDSSLGNNGGELIFDRIRLDDQDDVSKLHQAINLVRQQIKAGLLQVSLACGLHIHVDAHQFGVGDTRNLVLVTNYLEDVIYRLSAAKYKRHRGTRYATPLEKGPFKDKREFGVRFFPNNGHASALNVEHYWTAMRNNCSCGAVIVGEHESCQCNLGKCTFEFRFFNGTANFRKVHAYAALAQSMVSFAKLSPDLDEASFPPQEYDGRHAGAGLAKKDKWEERLRWMLTNLYFAPNERESIRYCVDHSALSELGAERIESIFQTEYVVPDAPAQTVEHRNPRGSVQPDNRFLDQAIPTYRRR